MCGIMAFYGEYLDHQVLKQSFEMISYRGPDRTSYHTESNLFLGFHRLAIMDLSDNGQQPFVSPKQNSLLVCNGEVYNYKALKEELATDYDFISDSDCEVILPLVERYGIQEAAAKLDAEFAFVCFDRKEERILAARDPIGIRPLFYGYTREGGYIGFCSEAKPLAELCEEVFPFPPGHYYDGKGNFIQFRSMTKKVDIYTTDMDVALVNIKEKLIEGVKKRLDADAPVGFLLSGGLDSSLVCSIASKFSDRPIRTFAVGTNTDAIDIKYATQVAEYIGAEHTNVTFTTEEGIEALKDIIYHLETWDITTIRASIGMYLVCKYIRENTDIKVLLTGEVSDEIFGYKYTDFAPSGEEFQKEACKRVDELYMYDVLRADRCISGQSLEARVPFSDLEFVDAVMAIHPEMKMNSYNVGKYLLRKAFDNGEYLPSDILYREKAAFSDAVGHSMVDVVKRFAEEKYSDKDLKEAQKIYKHGTPFTKESLLYREIFEQHFPGRVKLIKDFWMPNKSWENCDVADPSARALPNYGTSGK